MKKEEKIKNIAPKKGYIFQKCVYAVLRVLFGWLFCLITGYSYEKRKLSGEPFLLLSNHTMDLDPICNVIATASHMKFVASANIMRGFPGCFVKWLAGPIPRYKGAPADDVVEAVKENLKMGISVAMYPEGNTSWDGETGYISLRTAQLVKDSNGSLVTFVNYGGYLRMPRWSKEKRKGKIFGKVVNEYSRETLNKLSVDEIYEKIKKDLYVNAYEVQEKNHYKYRCKNLAEGLEAALYVCPKCKKVGTLKTTKDKLECSCGALWSYDLEGYLKDDKDEKTSILQWSKWQKTYLNKNREKYKKQIKSPICVMDKLAIYGDRLEVKEDKETKVYELKNISKLSIFRATRLFFTYMGENKEVYIDPKNGRVGQGFYALWRICTDREYV